MSNQREYYRIEYPAGEEPIFHHSLAKFKVLDVSEGGFSFTPGRFTPPVEGEEVTGQIQFGNRAKIAIKGVVARVGKRVSVKLYDDARIPLPRIMEEQRFMIRRARP